MSYYLVRPCKSTAAYEAIPRKERTLDLKNLERVLETMNYKIQANAEVVLVVSKDDFEISIFKKGRLMIKVEDAATAKIIADDLEKILF